jgi:predicted RNA methylase
MIEQLELALTAPQPRARRAELGQFMTPAPIARFMASLFEPAPLKRAKLLDAGAGEGALSAAFIERRAALDLERIDAHAYELDATVYPALCRNLKRGEGCVPHPFNADFIEQASALRADFTHAILNPPYKKISASSAYRRMLSGAGIETVNLYSGFVALALSLLAPGGQLVASIPRSFCNGPYYRPFRQWIFERAAIRRIHLFESRTSPFKEDEVLQETVIIHLERGAAQGEVILSSSTGAELDVVETRATPFEQIVHTGDAERFIHIPTTAHGERREEGLGTFEGLGIKVSTGPSRGLQAARAAARQPRGGLRAAALPAAYGGAADQVAHRGREEAQRDPDR